MRKENCGIFAYIDVFIMISPENDSDSQVKKLFDVFSHLGLTINQGKFTAPSSVLTCLGITINLDNNSLSIVKAKMDEKY